MMNTDGTTGGNNMGLGQTDDQQMITLNDRENFIARLTHHFNGNREMAKHYDDQAITRSGGKAVIYKKVLQMLLQQRSQQIQQIQQQQQQQQSMMTPQQQQSMYMQSQQTPMVGMPQQQQQQPPPPTYTMQAPLSSSIPQSTSMMNIKQEPQAPMSNIQMRPNAQNFPMQQQQIKQELMVPPIPQQQQQIKQELMVPPIPQQQQIKQELMVPPIPQQQPGVPVQQMRQQQPAQYNQQQQAPVQYNQQQQAPVQYNPQQQQQSSTQYNQQQQPSAQYNQQQPSAQYNQQQQPSTPYNQQQPSTPYNQQQPSTPYNQQQPSVQYNQQQQQPSIQYNQQQPSAQYNPQQQQPPVQYNQQQQQQPPPSLPNQSATTTPQQRNIVQQLQQVRQQNYLNQQQQQQQESSNSMQMQQQQPNPSNAPQSSSMNSTGSSSTTSTPTTSVGSSDEILQQLLTSPNPPKQPSTVAQNAAQARLRTINRNIRNQTPQMSQQQPSPMTPGSDPMMTGNVPSPHSHPGMMQQPPTPIGPPVQSPLARYMMAQSPQASVYRPQMSPMNMMNYAGSPTAMIDDEMHYLFKYFTDRIHYLTRVITRCQQEGQHDKVAKYRQLHDQMAVFVRNPIPEHIMAARRLKDHVDRILDPRMFGPVMIPSMVDMTGMIPSNNNNGCRLMTNGIFEQCQRAIVDYLGKDTTLKYNVAKRFLEPLSDVINGVPHKNIRLDMESKQLVEPYYSSSNNHSSTSLINIIESEFAHLSMNTFTYELKPLSDKMPTSTSIIDAKDSPIRDYELTCRFIEINMPVVPPLKMKLTVKYPNEPPEVLSLTSTTLSLTPAKLENSDGHSFFESISRNFIYFLFKLPAQHTVTDILDIWRTAIQNASSTQQES